MREVLGINVWYLAKWVYLFAFLLYFIFAVVMVRQVKLMTKALEEKLNPTLCLIAWVHLGLSLGIILLALLVL